MHRPEPIDHIGFIARHLGCSLESAIEVLGRVHRDPEFWRSGRDSVRLGTLASYHANQIRIERSRPSTPGDHP